MSKQVIVPQNKLDKLEEARVRLYEFYEHYLLDQPNALSDLQNITAIMYELGNRNYPEYKEQNND